MGGIYHDGDYYAGSDTNDRASKSIITNDTAYNPSKSYVAGDWFIDNDVLYEVKIACQGITPPNATYYTVKTLHDLKSEIDALKSDTDWINLNSTYPTYYRAKGGFVTVVMRLGGGSTPTSDTVLGTIPQGYRPKYQMVVATHNLKGNVMVDVNGKVIITENNGQTLNAYMGAVLTYPY